jgi:type I restriction enzyme R subunit
VVSKLLTGFDAPSCTYIYLDNELRDHNLFQAICRTNRLDGDDKDYGHIVDFKELFGDVQQAIAVYSSDELDIDRGAAATTTSTSRTGWKKARSSSTRPRGAALPVRAGAAAARGGAVPALLLRRRRQPKALNETEPLRVPSTRPWRCFARLRRPRAGPDRGGLFRRRGAALQKEVEFYAEIRAAIKKHSGEELDIKPYEADMRHLINTYIQADPAPTWVSWARCR